MIREVKFESQDRRIKGIIEALNANGSLRTLSAFAAILIAPSAAAKDS